MTARETSLMDKAEVLQAQKANEVWGTAFKETLAAGISATVVRGARLVEVRPNGEVVSLGKVARRRRVKRPLQGRARWAAPLPHA